VEYSLDEINTINNANLIMVRSALERLADEPIENIRDVEDLVDTVGEFTNMLLATVLIDELARAPHDELLKSSQNVIDEYNAFEDEEGVIPR
jgi:hypothetical protein